jgi:hypothetical protein
VRELALLGCSLAVACREPPQADPAKVVTLATAIIRNNPVPGAAPTCTPDQLQGNASMTMRTVFMLAEQEIPELTGLSQWINPTQLDSPAALTLVDPKSSEKQRRQAAAELLAAPAYLVYVVDHVAAPLALGVRETKRGSVGARALRYSTSGQVTCIVVFDWLNDDNLAREAYTKLGGTGVPADVMQKQREDLAARYLLKVQSLAIPPPKT